MNPWPSPEHEQALAELQSILGTKTHSKSQSVSEIDPQPTKKTKRDPDHQTN